MRLSILLPLLIVFAGSLGGCVQTAMLPADTLEEGETRGAVSVAEPGALFLPRLTAQVTRGFGDGDLTANVSAVPVPEQPIVGGGLAARSYLAPDLSVEGQLQGTIFAGQPVGLALFGVQTIPSDDGGWYGGGQAGVVSGPSLDVLFGEGFQEEKERTWTGPVLGGTVGYGPIDVGSSTRLQIEGKANLPIWGDRGEPPLVNSGVSIGVFGLFQ